jgi:hypothetical protein
MKLEIKMASQWQGMPQGDPALAIQKCHINAIYNALAVLPFKWITKNEWLTSFSN